LEERGENICNRKASALRDQTRVRIDGSEKKKTKKKKQKKKKLRRGRKASGGGRAILEGSKDD